MKREELKVPFTKPLTIYYCLIKNAKPCYDELKDVLIVTAKPFYDSQNCVDDGGSVYASLVWDAFGKHQVYEDMESYYFLDPGEGEKIINKLKADGYNMIADEEFNDFVGDEYEGKRCKIDKHNLPKQIVDDDILYADIEDYDLKLEDGSDWPVDDD